MKTIDCLIQPRWIAPVVPQGKLLEACAIAVHDGAIIDICTSAAAAQRYQPINHYDLPEHLLFPGLVNSHGHAAMTLLKGFADDQPLKVWLEQHIWPAEAQHVCFDFVSQGTELAIAEMLLSGTTCFSDMYFYPQAAAKVVHASGIRAQLCFPVLDFPTPGTPSVDQYFSQGLKLHDEMRNHSRITIAFGPHAPYTVSDEHLERVATLASELDLCIQIHLHETAEEVETSLAKYGMRPIERLAKLGILGPKTQCVHMTQVDAVDLQLLADHQCHVIHCPESNMKLASGICPADNIQRAGINIALGTDGAASNNDLNMIGEMKTAALLGKVAAERADVLSAHDVLTMATLNGAKALGLEDKIGSIEVGKRADFAVLKIDGLSTPVYDPISQLVYTDCAHNISHVWVDGRLLVENRRLTSLDQDGIIKNTQDWQTKIAN
ncbi:TRZ/ATZ family hydrolase [Simiduia curdlanivorans]|uniref:TRZ/ATZ family hydrolase n=1 Tax=Simiduia curdlanivorans TaxID=1492769 RepID=A0ABV8V7B4_9GAMM|nr:TRZ/ATZ family hydrolase [Simiduia curdlanivorans]MDN3639891.1 TRZ/ATZ family hydrolase [Simiduia curdlanivorans]MDN3639914.1 TRZ/ATZ family hydrolase [Simiduia curdlanivorans]